MEDMVPELVDRVLRGKRVVLAVSGGRDSMSLLHAAHARARASIACVATFDHATGAHAAESVALVRGVAARLGLHFVTERASTTMRTEAEWRAQRWSFLHRTARECDARVATAHTRDDQLETVLMRTMRGSGARGLAALRAETSIARPLLESSRENLAAYAARARLEWVEDPGNARPDHLRNRIRHDLLPALARAAPSLATNLLALGERAATLRAEVEALVVRELSLVHRGGAVIVARDSMARFDADALALLWPAVAAYAGATLDRRGTDRLVAFTISERSGARIQLSGGFEVVAHRDSLILRRAATNPASGALSLHGSISFGNFRFHARDEDVVSLWSAKLPAKKTLTVRTWHSGDRMIPAGGDVRRVKGLLRDAGIDAASRSAWPVVLADDEIVWVPGVRRNSAASARSGRPMVTYHCERIDR
ncbi:MAG: tRNA lysidine(34) synthetase TilS [Gemmatimonadaceae bacterium]|nr:tRNA lysidine(34) synthetase TilS [Gemmatimonadaceae bacterium]